MDDLVQFIRDRYDEDEVAALATTPVPVAGRWKASRDKHADRNAPLAIIQGADDVDPGSQEYSSNVPVIAYAAEWHDEAEANLRHIARHDPQRVLADVEAKRQQLDSLLSEKHAVVEDCWYTCAAATEERDGGETCRDDIRGEPCECGRDYRLARGTRLLALPYADHPAYREEWRL